MVGRMKGFRIIGLTAVIAGFCLAQCEIAQADIGSNKADAAVDPTTGGDVAGYPNHKDVSIPVKATVAANCGFDTGNLPTGLLHAGDLNGTFDQQKGFGLHCQLPVLVAITSTNGALQTATTVPTGYAGKRDYLVQLFLKGSGAVTAQAECAASTLKVGGSCSFVGDATQAQVGLLLNGPVTDAVGGSFVRVHDDSPYVGPTLVADPTPGTPSYIDYLNITMAVKN